MNRGGYFKFHRRLGEHPLWTKHRFSPGQAWVDLLYQAEWEHRTIHMRQKPIQLEAGELYCSLRGLASRWKWDVKTVSKFLAERDAEHMLLQRKTRFGTVITIRNWSKYQGNGTHPPARSTTRSEATAYQKWGYSREEEKKRTTEGVPGSIDAFAFARLAKSRCIKGGTDGSSG